VIKHNGTRELFNREKLLGGLYRACEKTTTSNIQIEQIVSNIESKLYALGEAEISSSHIGQIVMDELRDVNEVAYVRFASVYRRFSDIAGFEKELTKIRTSQKRDNKK
jgi:transcriptional repressor NrdR